MKIVALICRILLGLAFVVFGANILHDFMHMPAPPAGTQAGMFMAVFIGSGWMKLIGAFQILGGLLVLFGGTLPLGLCILGPLLVNILCFHAFLTGGVGIGAGVVFSVLWLVLLYAYRGSFAGIFTANATPTA